MWKVSDQLTEWIQSKQNNWRKCVFNEFFETVQPTFQFDNTLEPLFKLLEKAEKETMKIGDTRKI